MVGAVEECVASQLPLRSPLPPKFPSPKNPPHFCSYSSQEPSLIPIYSIPSPSTVGHQYLAFPSLKYSPFLSCIRGTSIHVFSALQD